MEDCLNAGATIDENHGNLKIGVIGGGHLSHHEICPFIIIKCVELTSKSTKFTSKSVKLTSKSAKFTSKSAKLRIKAK
ncbi:hypothetical protein [Peribacillus simplex]|uniref:hypothetical protein n=1 Tax=Peribacillus simplex TaxID=1478 RepID=UPI000BA5FA68|nr:hypothetical protein [Peribacillus simplex]PAK43547.1 hypothetical protein CHI08_06345 [Peribacillus simplex]